MKIYITTAAFVAALAVGIIGLVAWVSPSAGAADPPREVSVRSDFSVAQATAFDEYSLFSAGSTLDGTPLAAVLRRDDASSSFPAASAKVPRADWVSFLYTSGCTADADGFVGCKDKATVQVWPACERNFGSYARASEMDTISLERIKVRGVPATISKDDGMLELYTGDSTVVLFADTEDKLLALAEELVSVNASALGRSRVVRGQDLPPPAADSGASGCSGR